MIADDGLDEIRWDDDPWELQAGARMTSSSSNENLGLLSARLVSCHLCSRRRQVVARVTTSSTEIPGVIPCERQSFIPAQLCQPVQVQPASGPQRYLTSSITVHRVPHTYLCRWYLRPLPRVCRCPSCQSDKQDLSHPLTHVLYYLIFNQKIWPPLPLAYETKPLQPWEVTLDIKQKQGSSLPCAVAATSLTPGLTIGY